MKTVLALLAAMALSSGCVSGNRDGTAAIPGREEIRVGVEANFKPVVFAEGGKIKGIEPDLIAEVGKISGATMRVTELPWNDLIPTLEAGRIDVIMSGMTITEERGQRVAFTDSYMRVGQMALMRTADASEFSSAEKILATRKKVGFIRGTTGDVFVRSRCASAEAMAFQAVDVGVAALSAGKIDVFVVDAPVVWEMSNPRFTALLEPLTDERLGWAVRKDDEAMLRLLNECLQRMETEGTLSAIRRRWMPQLLQDE
jgi:polar amino acid transport system substrate-binding protein